MVNSHFRLHEVNNMRVIDASIFAVIPDCRTQNIVYMVGEQVCHAPACKDAFKMRLTRKGGYRRFVSSRSGTLGL